MQGVYSFLGPPYLPILTQVSNVLLCPAQTHTYHLPSNTYNFLKDPRHIHVTLTYLNMTCQKPDLETSTRLVPLTLRFILKTTFNTSK